MTAIKERPIIFNPPMVKALLAGRKTQTRRIIKRRTDGELPLDFYDGMFWFADGDAFEMDCPKGQPGDGLWVKENYSFEKFWEAMGCDDWAVNVHYPADDARRYVYQCDAPEDVGFWPGAAIRKYEGKMRPSIFMYRWVSRITLEITDVRAERLQDISEEDAKAEGCEPWAFGSEQCMTSGERGAASPYRGGYACLWDDINADRATWKSNPLVWAISFKAI